MKWGDVYDIAIALEEKYPHFDILGILYTDLWKMIQDLEGFDDDPQKCSEKILESIQMAWLEERD